MGRPAAASDACQPGRTDGRAFEGSQALGAGRPEDPQLRSGEIMTGIAGSECPVKGTEKNPATGNQYNGPVYFAVEVIKQRGIGAQSVFLFDQLLLQARSMCGIGFRAELVAEVPDVVQYTESVHSAVFSMASKRKC